MTENEKKVRKFANRIKKYMKDLSTYKPQYDNTIWKLAEIEIDILQAKQEFEENGSQLLIEKKSDRGAVNSVINPLKIFIDRKQNTALSYYKELGFTAQSFKRLSGEIAKDETKKTTLVETIEAIENEIKYAIRIDELEEENENLRKELDNAKKGKKVKNNE